MTGVRQGGHDMSLCWRGFTWHCYCRLPIDNRPASTGRQVLEKSNHSPFPLNPSFTDTQGDGSSVVSSYVSWCIRVNRAFKGDDVV